MAAQEQPGAGPSARQWAVSAALFVTSCLTTLWMGGTEWNAGALLGVKDPGIADVLRAGVPYAAPLMAILLLHEMGHFVAGKLYRLRLTPPFFIPIPFALGTMGAIIVYRSRIESARKLLDVAVAGPLSGVAISTVLMLVGLNLSTVRELAPGMGAVIQEGQSLYYLLLKWVVFGRLPAGHDVFLHPVAWSAWVGLFVTMINLLPVGQLDGGHVAYALLGRRQDRVSAAVHVAMVALAAGVGLWYGGRAFVAGRGTDEVVSEALGGSFWLTWAVVLLVLKKVGRGYHPPVTMETELGRGRLAVAIGTLVLFVLLFMPAPIRVVVL